MITQEQFSSLRKGDTISLNNIEYIIEDFDKKTDRIMRMSFSRDNDTRENTSDAPYTYYSLGNQIERIIKGKIDNWKELIQK